MGQGMRSVGAGGDEINFWELLRQLKSGWKWLAGGGGLGLLGAFGFLIVTPAQYEATVVIQPATIGMPAVSTAMTVEPVTQTLERLRLVAFYTGDIVKDCQVGSAKELENNVRADLVKGNALLSISYRTKSAALANACVSRIVRHLIQSQSAISAPLVRELEEQKILTKQQMDETEQFLEMSYKRAAQSSALSEYPILIILKREELIRLKKLYREQRTQLTEPLTKPMKILAPIYTPDNPVSPQKRRVIASGLVGGLFAGLFIFLVNCSRRHYKSTVAGN